jgi:hypothetical protein
MLENTGQKQTITRPASRIGMDWAQCLTVIISGWVLPCISIEEIIVMMTFQLFIGWERP